MTQLLWFRRDLRLGDHPALLAAVQHDPQVLGVFVADDVLMKPSGGPRRAFLAGCLHKLNEDLGGRLFIQHGRPEKVIPALAASVEADTVHVTADFGPYGRQRDEAVRKTLAGKGIGFTATGSPYVVAPGRVAKADGSAYAVFTSYYHGWMQHGWRAPAESTTAQVQWIDPKDLSHRQPPEFLSASIHPGMQLPEPGEQAGLQRWQDFLDRVDDYQDQRNFPGRPGTSRLSMYLKWGCLHPRTQLADLAERRTDGAAAYRRELAFRDFYADQLFHYPDSARWSLDPVVDKLQFDEGPTAQSRYDAWKAGRTGYPFIDAGMRQLLAEGWIHNRVRMAVASFLIKDLHLRWQTGARHFMHHLVDGDVASNQHNWQWTAGSGSQAAPFYRIFNPVLQGQKFDPDGDYIRHFVPELREVTGKYVHTPWQRPAGAPKDYPARIVDHDRERREALRRWENRPDD